jgi:tetratricopeptide (TPR) repeat protein
MSYINDALRKAQKEKDGRYGRYSGIISRLPGPRGHGRAKWIFAAVSLMMLTALFVWWTTADRQERPVAATQATPEKAAAGQMQATAASGAGPERTEAAAPTAKAQAKAVQPEVSAVRPETSASGRQTALLKPSEREVKKSKVEPATPRAQPAKPVPDPGALYQKALAAQRNKKTAAAERLYRRILTLDAAHTGAMNNLGVIYMSRGRHDQALALFKKAIAERKDYVDPYYNLACLYAQRQDAAGSIAYLKSAAAINRAVIDWARTDKDLKPIREMDDFKKLLESGE